VLAAAVALCALAPSVFMVPDNGSYRVLAGLADVGLLAACLYLGGSRLRVPALIVVIGAAITGTLAMAAAWHLAPLVLAYASAAFCAAIAFAMGALHERALFAYVVATTTGAKWLLCAAASLQEGDAGHALANPGGICRVDEIAHPGRRYNVVTSTHGDLVASFLPQHGWTEVYKVGTFATEPQRTLPIAPNRVVVAREERRVYGVDFERGLFTLDLDDLSILEEPPPRPTERCCYMGIAYRPKAGELLILRGDGVLSHIDRDTRAVRAEVDFLSGEWLRFGEELHSVYLAPGDRLAVIVKANGPMWLYDAETHQILARHRLHGSTGNIVFSPDGERLFVAGLFTGRLYELKARDLSEIRSIPLGLGFRYLRLSRDGRHLLVGNYFTGAVAAIDLETHAVVAQVSVGQRIQWIEPHTEGDQYWVSHAAGLTLLDLRCLVSERPMEPPLATLSGQLHPSALVHALGARRRLVDPSVLANLAIVVVGLRGSMRRHSTMEDKRRARRGLA
jgi:DNA-binding beta-propeller fold protein YncE